MFLTFLAKLIFIGIIITFLPNAANADVTTHNRYYTNGGKDVVEDVVIKNMDYTNSVNIDDATMSGKSEGSLYNTNEPCSFKDRLEMRSNEGVRGADLEITAWDSRFERKFSSNTDYFSLGYSQGTGTSKAISFDPKTSVIEDVETNGNEFTGYLSGSDFGLYTNGAGQSIGDDPSSFIHEIVLNHNGKSAKTESFLKAYGSPIGGDHVKYGWNSMSGSSEERAYNNFESNAYRGNLITELGITGFSDVFPYNQRAPEKPEDYPAVIYPAGLITAEHLYMAWVIGPMG